MLVPFLVPIIHGRSGWWIPDDAWLSLRAAHYVPQGTYPLIYEAGVGRVVFDSGPLLPLMLAPVAAIGDLFHLRESYPLPQAHPVLWLVVRTVRVGERVPLLYAVRALATQLGMRAHRALLQWAALLLAFVPMAIVYGHYEDVIALALLLLACKNLFAGRELRGALLSRSRSASSSGRSSRYRSTSCACPDAAPRPCRGTESRSAGRADGHLPARRLPLREPGLAPPARLHRPRSCRALGRRARRITWRACRRRAAIVIAVVAALWLGRNRDPLTVMSVLGAVFLCRFLFEPVAHAYYLAPGLVLLLMGERAVARIVTKASLAGMLLVAFSLHPDRVLWWTFVYAGTALLLLEPIVRLAHRPFPESPSSPPTTRRALVRRNRSRHPGAEARRRRLFASIRPLRPAFLCRCIQGSAEACR